MSSRPSTLGWIRYAMSWFPETQSESFPGHLLYPQRVRQIEAVIDNRLSVVPLTFKVVFYVKRLNSIYVFNFLAAPLQSQQKASIAGPPIHPYLLRIIRRIPSKAFVCFLRNICGAMSSNIGAKLSLEGRLPGQGGWKSFTETLRVCKQLKRPSRVLRPFHLGCYHLIGLSGRG